MVTRVLDASGRSRARIDGRPVALRDLQRFGAYLLEIHGQGQNRSLMRPGDPDRAARRLRGAARRAATRSPRTLRELSPSRCRRCARCESCAKGSASAASASEFLRYCLDEIAAVDPQAGRDRPSSNARTAMLGHLDALRQGLECRRAAISTTATSSSTSPSSICVRRRHARRMHGACREFDERLERRRRGCSKKSSVLLEEGVHELQSGLSRLELDPHAASRSSRNRLHELRRLHGALRPRRGRAPRAAARGCRVELEELDDADA